MTQQQFQEEPSQEVIDYLVEEMKLSFPLVKDRQPERITTRFQHGVVRVDVWSKSGQWIMSSETAVAAVEAIAKNPDLRRKTLDFLARSVNEGMERQRRWPFFRR